MRADTTVHEELGFYALAGQPGSSRELVTEIVEAEALGLGTAFISERYNKKEAATLSGAAGAVSERITMRWDSLIFAGSYSPIFGLAPAINPSAGRETKERRSMRR